MKRRLFNILAALSLIMLFVVALLWFRSISLIDVIGFSPGTMGTPVRLSATVVSLQGSIELFCGAQTWNVVPRSGDTQATADWRSHQSRIHRMDWLAFEVSVWDEFRQYPNPYEPKNAPFVTVAQPHCRHRWAQVRLPHWSYLLMLGVMPAAWITVRRRRLTRSRRGLCRMCGYDLRASPERCPECGTVGIRGSER